MVRKRKVLYDTSANKRVASTITASEYNRVLDIARKNAPTTNPTLVDIGQILRERDKACSRLPTRPITELSKRIARALQQISVQDFIGANRCSRGCELSRTHLRNDQAVQEQADDAQPESIGDGDVQNTFDAVFVPPCFAPFRKLAREEAGELSLTIDFWHHPIPYLFAPSMNRSYAALGILFDDDHPGKPPSTIFHHAEPLAFDSRDLASYESMSPEMKLRVVDITKQLYKLNPVWADRARRQYGTVYVQKYDFKHRCLGDSIALIARTLATALP